MTQYEQSAIVGYYRMGASWEWISKTMKISVYYAKSIVRNYINEKYK